MARRPMLVCEGVSIVYDDDVSEAIAQAITEAERLGRGKNSPSNRKYKWLTHQRYEF